MFIIIQIPDTLRWLLSGLHISFISKKYFCLDLHPRSLCPDIFSLSDTGFGGKAEKIIEKEILT